MSENNNKSDEKTFTRQLLRYLREVPTRRMRMMSQDLHTNRQRVWRRKRSLEKAH